MWGTYKEKKEFENIMLYYLFCMQFYIRQVFMLPIKIINFMNSPFSEKPKCNFFNVHGSTYISILFNLGI